MEGVCCEMRTPIGQVNRKGWEGVAGHNNIRAVTKYLLKDYLGAATARPGQVR